MKGKPYTKKDLDKVLMDPDFAHLTDNALVKVFNGNVSRGTIYRRREKLVKEGKIAPVPIEERINAGGRRNPSSGRGMDKIQALNAATEHTKKHLQLWLTSKLEDDLNMLIDSIKKAREAYEACHGFLRHEDKEMWNIFCAKLAENSELSVILAKIENVAKAKEIINDLIIILNRLEVETNLNLNEIRQFLNNV